MSRPNIVRADTLDLQDPEQPSAKDHTNQPAHADTSGRGPLAPHQDASIRHMQEERSAEQEYLAEAWGSSRSSHEGSELLDEDPDYVADGRAVPGGERSQDQSPQPNGNQTRSSEDSDVTDADGDENTADDDMMDKISSSPSIDDEDIDFEFVYALHTFVATVEGQANATKGDTMVLLDDSNSYWWLVRVVKDASIGYLPAEHIETPTERLARLNKHRNIDLSATMLSDNLEKSKNPLKKAMRRRNAKMVQFTTPTYYEASEVDWSEGENEEDSVDLHPDPEPSDQTQQQTESEVSANSGVEPVETTTEPMREDIATNGIRAVATEPANRDVRNATESERHSEESQDDGAPSKSRNGTIRNTDSFFGDNGAEPKKMSLTPPILKRESERSSAESPRSSESKEKSPTAETFEQITAGFSPSSEKFKEEKRRKDKKPGMLSGLFRRGKDKKIKVDEAAGGTVRTQQEGDNILTSPTSISPMDTGNNSPRERSPHAVRRQVSNGKLVKSPPPSAAPSNAVSATTSGLSSGISSPPNGAAITPTSSIPSINTSMAPKSAVTTTPTSSNATPTSSNISPGTPTPRQPLRIQTQSQPQSDSEQKREGGVMSPTIGLLSSSSAGSKKSPNTPITQPQGDARDDSALEEHDDQSANRFRNAAHTPPPRTAPSATRQQIHDEDELVSPVDPANTQDRYLPALEPSSKAEALSESPVSPTTPTESLSNSTAHTTEPYSEAGDTGNRGAASTAPSSTAPERHTAGSRDVSEEPTASDDEPEEYAWDDAALRTYLDESSTNDVKEMLWRVHDKSDVTPIPLDHPTMVSLGYGEQQKQLDDISSRLDGLLNSFLKGSESRQRAVGAMP